MLTRAMIIPAQKCQAAENMVKVQMLVAWPISARAGMLAYQTTIMSIFLRWNLSDSQPATSVPAARAT